MNCTPYHEWLQLRIDGELAPDHVEELQTHLAQCADCRVRVAELEEIRDLIVEVGVTPRPTVPRERTKRRSPRIPLGSVVASLAALALLALVLFLVDRRPHATETCRRDARLTITEGPSTALAVHLESHDPEIHIFWIYGAEKGTE